MNSHNLDLLSHSVEVNERSGGERNVGVEEETRGSSIDGAEDGAVQSESEGELVSVLGVREDILGVDPVLRPLRQQVRVLGQRTALQVSRVGGGETEGNAANVRSLRLQDPHHQTLPWLDGRVQEEVAVAELRLYPGGGVSLVRDGHILAVATLIQGGLDQLPPLSELVLVPDDLGSTASYP